MTLRRKKYLLRAGIAVAFLALLVFGAYRLFEDPTNQMFGPTVVSGPSDERVVALTYDDGPNPPYTDLILDVLKKERVHATFFLVGRAAQAYPKTVKRMAAEGHAIGNHTWDHAHLVVLRRSQMRTEMQRTDAAILRATGTRPHIMRPPFGARDWRVVDAMKRLGYAVIMWSVPLPNDWEYPGAPTIARRVVPNVKDGSIVVLHDGNRGQLCAARSLNPHVCDRSEDIAATQMIVEQLKARGFRFVTIPELIALHKETKRKPAHGVE
ncbi:MAG: polysaccharide deacetylase family protein [Candidatus Eremiobacteraeota bacterium]|nr:polysaccharide deacetylase family protein [Candidatus Eremiobacteraeota bacterium]